MLQPARVRKSLAVGSAPQDGAPLRRGAVRSLALTPRPRRNPEGRRCSRGGSRTGHTHLRFVALSAVRNFVEERADQHTVGRGCCSDACPLLGAGAMEGHQRTEQSLVAQFRVTKLLADYDSVRCATSDDGASQCCNKTYTLIPRAYHYRGASLVVHRPACLSELLHDTRMSEAHRLRSLICVSPGRCQRLICQGGVAWRV